MFREDNEYEWESEMECTHCGETLTEERHSCTKIEAFLSRGTEGHSKALPEVDDAVTVAVSGGHETGGEALPVEPKSKKAKVIGWLCFVVATVLPFLAPSALLLSVPLFWIGFIMVFRNSTVVVRTGKSLFAI